ncbi:hypothetical protein EC973_005493 [Apophysomyces ossiformis]|uniref:GATA-type domain-containing protein n=1 Tax=Apophysomyces ossiformis TaxID=679940 RepID=A0A8H7EL12_9FUNG|nr:hypothetical protein EC973_005493 [Apophysomyces ossiformis]
MMNSSNDILPTQTISNTMNEVVYCIAKLEEENGCSWPSDVPPFLSRWEENHLSSPRSHVPDLTLVGVLSAKPNAASAGFMLTQHLKDDVFLAEPAEFVFPTSLINDGTSAPNNNNNNSKKSRAWTTTTTKTTTTADLCLSPSVSPVSSPSDFLYNHEPLFDGIDDWMEPSLGDPGTGPDEKERDDDDQHHHPHRTLSSTRWAAHPKNTYGTTKPILFCTDGSCGSPELDWIRLMEDFHNHDLPTPSTTASEESESETIPTEEEDDDENDDRGSIMGSERSNPSEDLSLHDSINRLNLSDRDCIRKKQKKRSSRKKLSNKWKAKRKTHRKRHTALDRQTSYAYSHIDMNHCLGMTEQEEEKEAEQYTFFEQLTMTGIDWCRYCGTTEGVNWRPGPWGKRTLCNKHGCDYKGYGLASRLPRLDLSAFLEEDLRDRRRPIVQQFCVAVLGLTINNAMILLCHANYLRLLDGIVLLSVERIESDVESLLIFPESMHL